jgi:hypothetical protein
MKNRKGWIKIVEAFIAIIFLMAVILVVIARQDNQRVDLSLGFRNTEISILREIETNNTFRDEILGTTGSLELSSFPAKTKAKIESRIPINLICTAKICEPSGPCVLSNSQEQNVYVEQVMITSNSEGFGPRMLKLFCWES